MTSATNLAALELPEPPVRPHLTLLDGRVQESVLIGRALASGVRGSAAAEELYRRYRPAVSRLAASFSELDPDEGEGVVQEAFVRAFRALSAPELALRIGVGKSAVTMLRERFRAKIKAQLSERLAG